MSLPVIGQLEPCDEQALCRNSPIYVGELGSGCRFCCLAKQSDIAYPKHRFRPVNSYAKHHELARLKRDAKWQEKRDRAAQRAAKSRPKQAVLRRARRAEKRTESSLIQATKNSGRSRSDGDHLAAGRITLDTKHQSQRVNPVVKLGELEKVRQDARRAKQLFGALVIRNRSDAAIVALHEDDFALLIKLLQNS